MKYTHDDYFLRRIRKTDRQMEFITSEEGFNTPSKTLHEFVMQDMNCNENGAFITYVFENNSNIHRIARMKPIIFDDFIIEMKNYKSFNLDELSNYKGIPVIYMSRAGVARQVDGLGWGTMLRSFLDGHARLMYRHFLLYALINEQMYKSMLKRYGTEFYKLY